MKNENILGYYTGKKADIDMEDEAFENVELAGTFEDWLKFIDSKGSEHFVNLRYVHHVVIVKKEQPKEKKGFFG